MTRQVNEGALLYTPSSERRSEARLADFARWLGERFDQAFPDYETLWRWSVADPGAFWHAVHDYFEVVSEGDSSVALVDATMPGAKWFPKLQLNYAENALRDADDSLAVVGCDESVAAREVSRAELRALTARVAAALRERGVGKGDRVVAWAPNTIETLAAFLATASLGAIWSSCSPEFGSASVLDRFGQIEPKVLFAVDGYDYGGKRFDRRGELAAIVAGLPTLATTVVLPDSESGGEAWGEFLVDADELRFERVDFDHPLWILYSSGTTGLPKAIVQGHGGIVLEHLKALALHCDLGPKDRFFWFSTTGWMMWNFLISGLLVRAPVVLFDGSPAHPDLGALWRMSETVGVTYFGTSAPYLLALKKEAYLPREHHDVSRIRAVGSTGAPLPADGFAWVYDALHPSIILGSVSGGSDVCTAFVLSCPWLPVYAGEIQCAGLGCDVQSFDEHGEPVREAVGELVLTQPIPSMPVSFWGDDDGSRLRESYFDVFPSVWRHGDWVKHTRRGTYVIYGRSDSTLNRGGVRMGTSEFYRVVEGFDEVADSLVVDTSSLDTEGKLWLFLRLADGARWGDELAAKLKSSIRKELSPRHVPDEFRIVEVIPKTLNGKKMEIPIKKILNGVAPERAVNFDTVAERRALDPFLELAEVES